MYLYRDQLYTTETQVNEAIEENIGSNYNNRDVSTTAEFESEWDDVEDKTSWNTFKAWCKQEGLKPSHAESVRKYMNEVE